MRTTLDIDDDVLSAAKERARRENTTAGRIISDLARLGLAWQPPRAGSGGGRKSRFGFRPFPSPGAIVTNNLIDSLREGDAY